MTPQEKATRGVQLLKEAILEYLKKRPEGATASEIRDALGLNADSDIKGGHKYHLHWGVMNLLRKEDKVVRRDEYTPVRHFLTHESGD